MIWPLLEYCAQSLSHARYSNSAVLDEAILLTKELEQFQTQTLKALTNCPRATSPAIIRLFCGVEPLACRFEILKLRYYWKILKDPAQGIAHQILIHGKNKLLHFKRGIAHEVCNICCTYNIIHIWHGIARSGNLDPSRAPSCVINPLRRIKNVIISENLCKDLEVGRTNACSFAELFLNSSSSYQKKYHLVEPFCQPLCFASPKARKHFVKALLHPCSYSEDCCLFGQQYKDQLNHLLSACPQNPGFKKELHLRLALYNFPKDKIPIKKRDFMHAAFSKFTWRKCTDKFRQDVDF